MAPDEDPVEVAKELRQRAHAVLAVALDPDVTWTSVGEKRVREIMGRAMERTAVDIELAIKRYTEPQLRLTTRQFDALSRAIRSHGGPAEQAARRYFVDGMTLSEAARLTGSAPQNVHAAIRRYQRQWHDLFNANVDQGIGDEQ